MTDDAKRASLDPVWAERMRDILRRVGFKGYPPPGCPWPAEHAARPTAALRQAILHPTGDEPEGYRSAAATIVYARAEAGEDDAVALVADMSSLMEQFYDEDEDFYEEIRRGWERQHEQAYEARLGPVVAGLSPLQAVAIITSSATLSLAQMRLLDPWLDDPVIPVGKEGFVAYYCSTCGPHPLDPRVGDEDPSLPEGDSMWSLYPQIRWDPDHPDAPVGCCERAAKGGAGLITLDEVLHEYLSFAEQLEPAHVIGMWRHVVARVAPDELVDCWR